MPEKIDQAYVLPTPLKTSELEKNNRKNKTGHVIKKTTNEVVPPISELAFSMPHDKNKKMVIITKS
ncbi:MAG: hypothetical protein OEY52_16540 [Gammaproteobacteria bacterium]|nr:hypothetical protein [Gammaproteobacteria bacterium]